MWWKAGGIQPDAHGRSIASLTVIASCTYPGLVSSGAFRPEPAKVGKNDPCPRISLRKKHKMRLRPATVERMTVSDPSMRRKRAPRIKRRLRTSPPRFH